MMAGTGVAVSGRSSSVGAAFLRPNDANAPQDPSSGSALDQCCAPIATERPGVFDH